MHTHTPTCTHTHEETHNLCLCSRWFCLKPSHQKRSDISIITLKTWSLKWNWNKFCLLHLTNQSHWSQHLATPSHFHLLISCFINHLCLYFVSFHKTWALLKLLKASYMPWKHVAIESVLLMLVKNMYKDCWRIISLNRQTTCDFPHASSQWMHSSPPSVCCMFPWTRSRDLSMCAGGAVQTQEGEEKSLLFLCGQKCDVRPAWEIAQC